MELETSALDEKIAKENPEADDRALAEMDEASFRAYRKCLIRGYAADKARAGVWSADEAEDRSEKEVDGLLPEGTATRDHYLYSVRNESGPACSVGWPCPASSPSRNWLTMPVSQGR